MVGGGRSPQKLDGWSLWDEIMRRRAYIDQWAEQLIAAMEEGNAEDRYRCRMGLYQHQVQLRYLWQEHERRAGRAFIIVPCCRRRISERTVLRLRQEYATSKPKPSFLYLAVKYGISKTSVRMLVLNLRRIDIAS